VIVRDQQEDVRARRLRGPGDDRISAIDVAITTTDSDR